MVKFRKAFFKSVLLLFRKEWIRFLLLVLVNLVGVGVMSGLGPCANTLKTSYSEKMVGANAPDLIGYSTSEEGYSDETLTNIENFSTVEAAQRYISLPYDDGIFQYQYYIYDDYDSITHAKPTLIEGHYPTNEYEIAVEQPSETLSLVEIGDVIRVTYISSSVTEIEYQGSVFPASIAVNKTLDCTVVGIVNNPMYGDRNNYPSMLNPEENLTGIYYLHRDFKEMEVSLIISIPTIGNITIDAQPTTLPYNAISISFSDANSYNIYSDNYIDLIDQKINGLTPIVGDTTTFLTLQENVGVVAIGSYADKVLALSYILSVFFILIVILVITTTLARMVEEERSIIACYRSNGVDSAHIAFKYGIFATLSIAIGAIAGYLLLGEFLLYFIYTAFDSAFYMPVMTSTKFLTFGIIASLVTAGAALIATILVLMTSLKEAPARLLLPKAPKAGKKILLERIKPLWKILPFRLKSMFRNVFRHPIRSALTIISVVGSTALLFAGWGVVCGSVFGDLPNASMVTIIGYVVVVIGAALCFLVLTNIINIQVGEKTREIATLEVLGYSEKEVAMYIYREVDFLVIISIAIGIPVGVAFTAFIFDFIDFGSLNDVQWWVYLIVPAMNILMMLLSNLLLLGKIKRIDMNASLKAVE